MRATRYDRPHGDGRRDISSRIEYLLRESNSTQPQSVTGLSFSPTCAFSTLYLPLNSRLSSCVLLSLSFALSIPCSSPFHVFLSFSFFVAVLYCHLSLFLPAPIFLPLFRPRSVRRSKSQRILIKRVTHFEPDIHVTMANGSLAISRTHIASFIITGPDTTMNSSMVPRFFPTACPSFLPSAPMERETREKKSTTDKLRFERRMPTSSHRSSRVRV